MVRVTAVVIAAAAITAAWAHRRRVNDRTNWGDYWESVAQTLDIDQPDPARHEAMRRHPAGKGRRHDRDQ